MLRIIDTIYMSKVKQTRFVSKLVYCSESLFHNDYLNRELHRQHPCGANNRPMFCDRYTMTNQHRNDDDSRVGYT